MPPPRAICFACVNFFLFLFIIGPPNGLVLFKKGKDVHPLVDQQFGYVRLASPVLDLAGSELSFLGRSLLSFFTYAIDGVTAMLRGLHAKLCHAVLV